MPDVLSFLSFELAVLCASLGIGRFLWKMQHDITQYKKDTSIEIERARKDASAEHEGLMRKLSESIEQDRRNNGSIVEQIAKLDERNAQAHSEFLASLARLDERTRAEK